MLDKFSKLPPLRGTPREIDFPAPAGYRQLHPAVLDVPPPTAKGRLFQRKRLMIGLAIAAALHIGLILAWFLTPRERLKVGIDPNRWVPVVSIPQPQPAKPAPAAPEQSAAANPPVAAKKKSPHAHSMTRAGGI
jgi:hypothetical protein